MRVPDDYQFDARSPVGRYWLIHGVGFTVCHRDGRRLGVVEDVVVDPVEQRAESVTLRRRGLLPGRRHETIDPDVVEAVVPASRLFVVEPAAEDVAPTPRAEHGVRLRVAAAAASAAIARLSLAAWRLVRRAAAASHPVLQGVLRHLGADLVVAGRLVRRGARASDRATVAAFERARANTPRLLAWASKRLRAADRALLAALRVLRTQTRAAARHVAALTRSAARALGELAVLIAMLVVAAARWAAASARPQRTPPADGETEMSDPESLLDADAPLGRASGEDASTPSGTRRRPSR